MHSMAPPATSRFLKYAPPPPARHSGRVAVRVFGRTTWLRLALSWSATWMRCGDDNCEMVSGQLLQLRSPAQSIQNVAVDLGNPWGSALLGLYWGSTGRSRGGPVADWELEGDPLVSFADAPPPPLTLKCFFNQWRGRAAAPPMNKNAPPSTRGASLDFPIGLEPPPVPLPRMHPGLAGSCRRQIGRSRPRRGNCC